MLRLDRLNRADPDAPIALLLPGRGYTAQAPLLYWSTEALDEAGWQVHAISWDASALELADALPFVEEAVAFAEAELGTAPDLIVAKSLGCFALPHAVAAGIPGVWLTPLLDSPAVAGALAAADARHLAIGGSADPAWLPDAVAGSGAELVTIAGATHPLELPGDRRGGMRLQIEVVDRVAAHAARVRG